MACAFGHVTRNALCDACDSESHDPDTGWGGFTDHFARKHFNSEKEQNEWYEKQNSYGGIEDEEEG